jgi:hypothetical protein
MLLKLYLLSIHDKYKSVTFEIHHASNVYFVPYFQSFLI